MTMTEAPRRGAKLGVAAAILVLLPAIYIGVTYLVGLGATGKPDVAATAEGMLWIGLFTVPGALFLAFVLGVIALIVDRPLGKILGLVGVLAFIAGIVLVVLFVFSPGGPAYWTDF